MLTAGKWFGDEQADKGIQTGPDARFYAVSADMGATFSNEGKTLVVQFSAKHEQKLDCGGRYIKLMPSSVDQKPFSAATRPTRSCSARTSAALPPSACTPSLPTRRARTC